MIPFHKLAVALVLSLTSATGSPRVRTPRYRASDHEKSSVTSSERERRIPLPPVLLMQPGHYGTLAAVRTFGRADIPVKTAGPTHWNLSAFSKYVSTSLVSPSTTEGENLIAWLEDFGRRNERHVLLPTCDDTAWLFARYRDRLAQYFHLSRSPISAVHALLHKAKLAEHARAVGLDTPKSWLARSEEELLLLADEVTYPLLLKPTTQALFPARSKGSIARNASELRAAYRHLAERAHASEITEFDPTSKLPIAQEFFTDASEAIYNISGFIRDGKLCGARAATKLLQLPRVLGVGVCFEEAPLDAKLAAGLERLAQRVGYDGVFEAEFVRSFGRDLLIDFNPRFYNQMGFDVARGLALPLLAYYDALRETGPGIPDCESPNVEAPTGKVFVNSAAFKMMVMSQGLSGALSPEEAAEWLEWYDKSDDKRVDAVADPDDVWPSRVNAVRLMQQHLRHPRHFLRAIVMNR